MEVINFILIVLLLIKVLSLQSGLNDLHKKSSGSSDSRVANDASVGETVSEQGSAPGISDPVTGMSSSVPSDQDMPSDTSVAPKDDVFIAWFKDNWISKIGILMILLGFGWFVSYAFVHNWIGPVGRITLGFVLGALVTVFGDSRMKKSKREGASVVVLGASVVLITIAAARFVYGFFNPLLGLILIFLTASYVTMDALRHDMKSLALSGLVMAAIAPLLIHSTTPDVVSLFLYIFVVSVASIWVMFYKNWRILGAAAALVTLLYSLFVGLFGELGSSAGILLTLAYLISGLFLVSNIASIMKFGDAANQEDAGLAIINGLLIILWTLSHAPDGTEAILLAVWMVISAFASFFVFSKTKEIRFFYIYAAAAVVYLVTATAVELDGNALVFAYIFESALIAILGYATTLKLEVGHKLSLLMVPPALMSLSAFGSSVWRSSVFHQEFAIILSMAVVLIGVGYFFYSVRKDEDKSFIPGVEAAPHTMMIIAGTYYLFGLIWFSLDAAYSEAVATFISLLIFTVIGISSYFFGKVNERGVFTLYGGFLLVIVVARLLLIDVWNMELALRIVTFIVIGILFVSTAFIGNKDKKKELDVEINNDQEDNKNEQYENV
jgi:uncharacterized membrane protein